MERRGQGLAGVERHRKGFRESTEGIGEEEGKGTGIWIEEEETRGIKESDEIGIREEERE